MPLDWAFRPDATQCSLNSLLVKLRWEPLTRIVR